MKKKTRTRIGSILLTMAMLLSLLPVTAGAATSVEYLDEDGTLTETETDTQVTEINDTDAPKDWSAGWYVVSGEVEISDRITVTGEVHLILADGCTLNAEKGISVTAGNSLTIYAQSADFTEAGTLDATVYQAAGNAGIGGNDGSPAHGDITINGGNIIAEGGNDAAGIGGGSGYGQGTVNGQITINGGKIEADGGPNNGAGIGGGYLNKIAGGDILISGGDVTATGGKWAAGIGNGYSDYQVNGRSITINGAAKVEAHGGSSAAGIGNGFGGSMGKKQISSITINGHAVVEAYGGAAGAGIGGSYGSGGGTTGRILIGGSATVTAEGGDSNEDVGYSGAGIGSGGAGTSGAIVIAGGTVTATGGTETDDGYNSAGIGSGSYGTSGAITVNAGTVTATSGGEGADGIGQGKSGHGGDFSTDRTVNGEPVPGKAVIYTDSITDTSGADTDDNDPWSGIIFLENEGTVYGEEIRLINGLVLKDGETLTVPKESRLIIPANKELIVEEEARLIVEGNGTLANNGTLTNKGTLLVEGSLNNNSNGTLTNNGTIDINGKLNDNGETTGVYVAEIGEKQYTSLSAAINEAVNDDTIEVLEDSTESGWKQTNTDLTNITINGNNHTLTVTSFTGVTSLNGLIVSGGEWKINNLTIDLSGLTDSDNHKKHAAIVVENGDVIDGVKVIGFIPSSDTEDNRMYGISVNGSSAADETASITNCKFQNCSRGVSTEANNSTGSITSAMETLLIEKCEFINCMRASILYAKDTTFTDNKVDGAKLNIMHSGQQITNNTFTNDSRISFYADGITFTGNTIASESYLEFTSTDNQTQEKRTLNLTGNDFGDQIIMKLDTGITQATVDLPTPTKSGYTFLGWYDRNTIVSSPYTVTADMTLEAQWKENSSVTPTPTPDPTPDTPSYDSGSSEPSGDYIVSVDRVSGGKVTVNPGRADKGDEVTVTVKPNDGYDLDELVVTDSKGNELELSYEGSGKYTFTMPSGTVDVKATFVKADVGSVLDDFTDVNPDAWYAQAVEFVVEEGLMTGTSATTFAPDTSMSRAMIWTVLAAYNSYNTSGGNPWYAPGQQWAMVNGVSDGTAPNSSITREQLAVMLWRAAGSPETSESLSGYADASSVSDWAVEALAWAVDNGIISGMGGSTLAPQATATRAQVAVMLMQFVDYMEA